MIARECVKKRTFAYNGTSASGSSRAVGGYSGSMRSIPSLSPGQSLVHNWYESLSGERYVTYKPKFTGTHNDGNNANHAPTTTLHVLAQPPSDIYRGGRHKR